MGSLMERLPDTSKTRAIEIAIEQFLAADAYDGLRDMSGTLDIDIDAVEANRVADQARVWIQYLRRGGVEPLDAALADRSVLMCGPWLRSC
jgi:hypothetical protein